MAIRSTVHQTGADAITELLRFQPPEADHRTVPCLCGQAAKYEGMRSRPILSAVGWAQMERAYCLCPDCHNGQFPADVQLDIQNTDYSPGVRRMLAAERVAETIGADIETRNQQEIRRAKQLSLPAIAGPHLYVQMDGTQVFVVKAETEGRAGRDPGQPARTRECKLGAIFTQTAVDDQGRPVRDEHSTTYVGAIETAEDFGLRLYTEAWKRGWDRATIRGAMGDGSHWIWNIADQHFSGTVSQGSERKAHAALDYPAVERCPSVYCPSPIGFSIQQEQKVPMGLTDIGRVPNSEKASRVPRSCVLPSCRQSHRPLIDFGTGCIRDAARVVALQTGARNAFLFPHTDNTQTLARSKRNLGKARWLHLARRTYVYEAVAENGALRHGANSSAPRFFVGPLRLNIV